MRWPLRRRRPAAGPAAPAVPPEPGRRGGRDEWRRLGPTALTASPRPPLLHDGLGSLPDVAGTRPLLPRAHGIGTMPSPWVTRPPSDARVLVHSSPAGWTAEHLERSSFLQGADGVIRAGGQDAAREAGSGQASAGTGATHVPGVPVRVAPVVDSPAPARHLTRATDEYVGQAREPATPYRSSEWLRVVASTRSQSAADPAARIAPLPPAPKPAARTPSRGASRPAPPADRAGLAASRRLGLGSPQPAGESGRGGEPGSGGGEPGNTGRGNIERDAGRQAAVRRGGRGGRGRPAVRPRRPVAREARGGPWPGRAAMARGGAPGTRCQAPGPRATRSSHSGLRAGRTGSRAGRTGSRAGRTGSRAGRSGSRAGRTGSRAGR